MLITEDEYKLTVESSNMIGLVWFCTFLPIWGVMLWSPIANGKLAGSIFLLLTFLLFVGGMCQASKFVFDIKSKTLKWYVWRLFGSKSGECKLDEIKSIGLEGGPSQAISHAAGDATFKTVVVCQHATIPIESPSRGGRISKQRDAQKIVEFLNEHGYQAAVDVSRMYV